MRRRWTRLAPVRSGRPLDSGASGPLHKARPMAGQDPHPPLPQQTPARASSTPRWTWASTTSLRSRGSAPGLDRYDAFLAAGRHADMAWMVGGREKQAPGDAACGARGGLPRRRYGWPRPDDPGGLTGRRLRVGPRLPQPHRQAAHPAPQAPVPGRDRQHLGRGRRPFIERAWAEQAGLGFAGRNCCTIVPGRAPTCSSRRASWTWRWLRTPRAPAWSDTVARADAAWTSAPPTPSRLRRPRCRPVHLLDDHREPRPDPPPFARRSAAGSLAATTARRSAPTTTAHRRPSTSTSSPGPDTPGSTWSGCPDRRRRPGRRPQRQPLRRAKAWGLKRNAALVLGNLGDPAARSALQRALDHPHPVVADQARWSLDRL